MSNGPVPLMRFAIHVPNHLGERVKNAAAALGWPSVAAFLVEAVTTFTTAAETNWHDGQPFPCRHPLLPTVPAKVVEGAETPETLPEALTEGSLTVTLLPATPQPVYHPVALKVGELGKALPALSVPESIHNRLLSVAPPFDAPAATDVLIRAAGYSPNSWSREKVTDLVAARSLYRHPRNLGVSLPERGAA